MSMNFACGVVCFRQMRVVWDFLSVLLVQIIITILIREMLLLYFGIESGILQDKSDFYNFYSACKSYIPLQAKTKNVSLVTLNWSNISHIFLFNIPMLLNLLFHPKLYELHHYENQTIIVRFDTINVEVSDYIDVFHKIFLWIQFLLLMTNTSRQA